MYLILAIAMMGMNNVAVLPKEVEMPVNKIYKKSKGKGNIPYFAKYF